MKILQSVNLRKSSLPFFIFIFLYAFSFFFFSAAYSEEMKSEDGNFTIIYTDKNEVAVKAVLNAAEEAKKTIEENLGDKIYEKITIRYAETQNDFFEYSKKRNEHILAYAIAYKREIIINGEALKREGASGLQKTLIHEYGHIYLGLNLPSELPRWLNEGLVMHLAGEGSFMNSLSVYKAHAMGNLVPMNNMEIGFPDDPDKMHLAYSQSYMITDYLIYNKYEAKNALALFIENLTDRENGKGRISDYWDYHYRDIIEANWKGTLGTRLWNWLFILTSGSIFWMIATVLFIMAYLKKRNQRYSETEEWAKEEAVYSSLSKKDEQEFWAGSDEKDEYNDGYDDLDEYEGFGYEDDEEYYEEDEDDEKYRKKKKKR